MKYCPNCGQSANDNDQYCSKCGSPLPFVVEDEKNSQPSERNIYAILGLIFAFVFWPAGLILSFYGFGFSKIHNGRGKALAIAGLIVSVLYFLSYTVLVILKIAGVFDYWYAIFGD